MGRFLIFAGAGVSQESGLNTFRDKGGIWEKENVFDLCSYPRWVEATRDKTPLREKIFDFYNCRKKEIQKALPNAAHLKVAEWQRRYGDKVIIITTNVDDLFEKAGCTDVIHVHGETTSMICGSCGEVWNIGQEDYNHQERCPKCNSEYTKPNIVFFGESAPKYPLMFSHFAPSIRSKDDVILYAGSSMNVIHPQTLFGSDQKTLGYKILINKDRNVDTSLFDYCYFGNATEEFEKADKLIRMIYHKL